MIDPIVVWLAKYEGLDPAGISDVRFDAAEGRAWSDVTFEDFSCRVQFSYEGHDRRLFLDERDVLDMLNDSYPMLVR